MAGQFTNDENFDWIDHLIPSQNPIPPQPEDDITTMFPSIDFFNYLTQQQDTCNTNELLEFDASVPQPAQGIPTITELDDLYREIFDGFPEQTQEDLFSQISSLPNTTTTFPPTSQEPLFPLLPTPSESSAEETSSSSIAPTNPFGFGFSAIQFLDCYAGSSQQNPRLPPPPASPNESSSPPNPQKRGNRYGRGGRLRCQRCRDQHGECIFDPNDLSKPCRRCLKARTKCPCIKTFGKEKRRMGGQ